MFYYDMKTPIYDLALQCYEKKKKHNDSVFKRMTCTFMAGCN